MAYTTGPGSREWAQWQGFGQGGAPTKPEAERVSSHQEAYEKGYRDGLARGRQGFQEGHKAGMAAGLAIGERRATQFTSEQLLDLIKLCHPDRHPPERRDAATKMTQHLNWLRGKG